MLSRRCCSRRTAAANGPPAYPLPNASTVVLAERTGAAGGCAGSACRVAAAARAGSAAITRMPAASNITVYFVAETAPSRSRRSRGNCPTNRRRSQAPRTDSPRRLVSANARSERDMSRFPPCWRPMHPGATPGCTYLGDRLGLSQAALAGAQTAPARDRAQTSAARALRRGRTQRSVNGSPPRPRTRRRRRRWHPRHRYRALRRSEWAPWDGPAHGRQSPSMRRVRVGPGSRPLALSRAGRNAVLLGSAYVRLRATVPRRR